jgi:hypothetical protein
MRKLLALILFLAPLSLHAQNVLSNLSYNGQLTSSCSTPNAACTNQVFVTTLGTNGAPQSSGAGSTLDIPVTNYAAATITISGTYSGVTIGFDFSDPTSGTNYFQEVCARTDISLLESSEVLPTNQVRAWQCPVWAAVRFRVRCSAFGSGAANINITITQTAIDPSLVVAATITNIAGASDPCQDVSAIKSSAPINIATAVTTQLIAPVAAKVVYVCGFSFTISQVITTANTLQFITGTGATCAVSTVTNSGLYGAGGITAAAPIYIASGNGATVFATASASGVCAVTAIGATGTFQGLIWFVQQ